MKYLRYAWRNLWRNKRRTSITLAAVTLNTAILIAAYALMDGMLIHMIRNATNIVMGEAQVHAEGYRDDLSFYKSINNPDAVLKAAQSRDIGAAPRSYGYGLVSVGKKSSGALFWGIEPSIEQGAFDLAEHIQHGQFLSDTPSRGIVLGKKLARSLQTSVGSEIIVVVQAADGSLGNDLYTVSGILKTVGDEIDRGAAILHQDDFSELFVSGNRIHEIALNAQGRLTLEELKGFMIQNARGAEVKTWKELIPALADMVGIMDFAIAVFGSIFFLAAGLGVMNTMLMATYERMREFGILKALGTSPWRIIGNMAAEAFVLTVAASVVGLVLGIGGAYYFQEVGINTAIFAGGFSFSGLAWDPIWRAVLSFKVVVIPIVVMCFICTVASLYPAIIAARLDPVRAIHHT
jgi:ABC-type lipoprotein release transport system permease subunit